MVNYRLVLLSLFSLLCASVSKAVGPYWDVKPSTWASGATLGYSVAMKGPRPWVDVVAFGATGNGTTDDLASIQRAIMVSTTSGGGIVYFPQGTYSISNQILVPDKVIIQGAGMASTTIKAASGFPSGRDVIHVGPNDSNNYTSPGYTFAQSIQIRDIHLDGTNTSGISYGIAAFGIDYFVAERVKISSTSAYGIIVQGTDTQPMKSPWVMYCHFNRCGRNGGGDSLGGGYNSEARYIFNTFENCYGTAIDNVQVYRALWQGNRSINNSFGTGGIWSDYSMVDSQIVDNYIENGSIHVYGDLGGGLQGPPNNILIANNHLKSPSSSAILVSAVNSTLTHDNVRNLRVIGNLIENATDYAINIGDAPGCIVANNQIYNWGYNSAAIRMSSGLNDLAGSTQCVVIGNTGTYGNSNIWYEEGVSSNQVTNASLIGNYFPGAIYTKTALSKTSYLHVDNGTIQARGAEDTNIFTVSASTSGAPVLFYVVKNGGTGIYARTLAQLRAITPNFVGQLYYCSDCTTDGVVVSTGTAIAAFGRVSSKTTAIQ